MNNIDNNNIELNKQKTNLKKSILVLLIVSIIGVLGVTLANVNKKAKVEVATGNYNVIITGNTQLSPSGLIPINNTSDTISPDNISNYSDSIFISDFTVKGAETNPVDQGIIYDIALIDSNIDTNLLNEYLKWELIKNNEILTSGNFKDLTNGQRYVLTDIQQDLPEYTQTADSLKLVIWINNNFPDNFDQTTMMNKSFSSTIDVELYTKSKIGWDKPNVLKFVNRQNANSITVGDELAVDTEHFYVVSSNENETVLLAKYNLYVGDIYNGYDFERTISETEEGYGLQNENARGGIGFSQRVGTVSFSDTNYWYENNTLKSEYGSSFPAYVYDSNSNIYQYVESYVSKLKNMGLSNVSGRLLNYSEIENLGCDTTANSCYAAQEWVNTTNYWTGAAEDSIWAILSSNGGDVNGYTYSNNSSLGVRPIIVVPTSQIKQ